MIEISPFRFLDESEITFEYLKASGPGGQNINKVSSAVRLRFNIHKTSTLNPEEKLRLSRLAGNRLTTDGLLIIEARRFRSQDQNRLDAIQRLVHLINSAIKSPKMRIRTRPSRTARASRTLEKKKRGDLKKTRRYNPDEWE
jgi:ribosome-associated protein